MVWRGVIIEESLENKCILNLVKIVDTNNSGKGRRERCFEFPQNQIRR